MSELSDRDLAVETNTIVKTMRSELLGGDGREGRIPKLETRQDEQASQINFWRGGIAVCAFLILVFGALLLAHMMGGH